MKQRLESLDPVQFCHEILPHVSRTFALGIRLLGKRSQVEVTISYLLCRIIDTVEDDLRYQ